jgi:type VI secretion system protein ImpL
VILYLFSLLFLILASVFSWLAGPLFHIHGGTLIVVRIVILLVGIAAAVAVILFDRRARGSSSSAISVANTSEIGSLIRDAQHRLTSSQRASGKSLDAIPLVYVLGDANSAKTTSVLRSGLDPELLAGQVYRDQNVQPTPTANFWYTTQGLLVEAGESLRQRPGLWKTLVRRTRPRLYSLALGARPALRAAVVCISCESFTGAGATESVTALARNLNLSLRLIAQELGTDLPVCVVFTKLDRVPGFAEYVRHLSTEEISVPLGIALPFNSAARGLYAEEATPALASSLDGLFFSLGQFRMEVLGRESELRGTAPIYEFPREMQKLRNNLVSCLVELTRPSHLNFSPWLRGFYFTGVRAHVSEQAVSVPAAARTRADAHAAATRILSLRSLQTETASASPQVVRQKVAQWCFLPQLFSQAVLAGQEALGAPRTNWRALLLRRTALGVLSAALLLWAICLTISWRNNARLEAALQQSAEELPVGSPQFSLASESSLASLDRLRVTLAQLEDYEKNGPPLMFRWGLYQGHSLIEPARRLYFDRFRRVLLARTQKNLVATLAALPATAPPDADYVASYNPLRAYLITTSYPDKSTVDFLTPVLVSSWLNGEHPASDLQEQLAERQFRFYAEELPGVRPYNIEPEASAVSQARAYLNSFGGFDRIYQNMIGAANRVAPSIDFNRLFPGSAATVVDAHVVPGAFTHDGFTYIQKAAQHPEQFFTGEVWVLGSQTAPSLDTSSLAQKLEERYAGDYSAQWRAFLHAAVVIRYRSVLDAKQKLQSLSAPNSSLLALLFTASHNTAVASPAIAHEFQPAQAVVSPESSNRFIGSGNTDYINGLIGLESAVSEFAQDPSTPNNPAAAQPVISAAAAAHGAVSQTAQSFDIDEHGHVEQVVISLLQAPIASVEESLRGAGQQQLNLAGRSFCAGFSALASKYPFSRSATVEATPDEVSSVLKPGTGSLWQFYDSTLKPYIVQQGDTWAAVPGATIRPTPEFLQFFDRATALSAALFPSGAATPSLSFTTHILPSKGIQSVTFSLDTQILTGANVSKAFTWSPQNAQHAQLIANYGTGSLPLQFTGTWSLFHLMDRGRVEQAGNPARLAYPLEIANTPVVVNGVPLTERLEISGAGANLLVPGSTNGLRCVSQLVR